MIEALKKRGYRITAVDAAPEMVARAKEEHSEGPDLAIEVGDVYSLKYRDASFDVVTAMGLIEYLADEEKAYREMTRVLKPGGILVISYPYLFSPWRIIGRIVMLFTWPLRKLRNVLLGTRGHYITHREYTVSTARTMMKKYGVTSDRVWFYNFKLIPWPLDQWFPRFTVWQSKVFEGLDSTPLRFIGTAFNLRGVRKEAEGDDPSDKS
jgi:SAM-dependent methyltransferase